MLCGPLALSKFNAISISACNSSMQWRSSSSVITSSISIAEITPEEAMKNEKKEIIKLKWVDVGPDITESQKQSISKLPYKMTKRCKALARRLLCFSQTKEDLALVLAAWVKAMKPRRADWLSVIKEIHKQGNPVIYELMEYALREDSFEANIRDYTKLINMYSRSNHLEKAENALQAMKIRGFTCDQVTMTVLVQMYSKAGNLDLAKEYFEEMKLLGLDLDDRAYGSMIMAYIRAGLPEQAERLVLDLEAKQIYPRREVYKAVLRAYSMRGNAEGAQRVFDVIQMAGIVPDSRLCALLMNAFCMSSRSEEARSVFENMRKAGIRPSDRCVGLILYMYEKENNIEKALEFLLDLEKDGVPMNCGASEVLARWFRRVGVVPEMKLLSAGLVIED